MREACRAISKDRRRIRRCKIGQSYTVRHHIHIVWLSLGNAIKALQLVGCVPEFLTKQIDINVRRLALVMEREPETEY